MKEKQKLPKRFKEQWIKALTSGKYRQGRTYLYNKSDNTFCCLGVVGSICGIDKNNLDRKYFFSEGTSNALSLIKNNKKFPILLTGNGNDDNEEYNIVVEKLAHFNDKGKSFKWIASYIKRYL